MREKISQNAMKSVFVCYLCIKYLSYTIMLINFSFGNFRSFRDTKSLRMEAGRVDDLTESVIEKDGFRLLPVAAIYGANSSGKTNVIKALRMFKNIVRNNSKLNPDNFIQYDSFSLTDAPHAGYTIFEIQFLLDNAVYKYGFEYLPTEIDSEWLYERKIEPNSKEHVLFYREGEDFTLSTKYFPEGKNKKELTTKNRLFLSLVAQLNGEISQKIISYLGEYNIISGLDENEYKQISLRMLDGHLEGYTEAMNLFKKLDLGFMDIDVLNFDFNKTMTKKGTSERSFEEKMIDDTTHFLMTFHNIYDKTGQVVGQTHFFANDTESNGTLKIIGLSGLLFNTLLHGRVLFVDELDAKLHPMLTRAIVRLFMDKETNPKGAQLVFTTHDTHLLDKEYLRRDQVWFTEKDAAEASDLYSLLEFKERNDRNFAKNYIQGRYGAIPFIR